MTVPKPAALSITAHAIERRLMGAGVEKLPSQAGAQFLAYLNLLVRWNRRLNLTSVRRPEEIVERHFVECAVAALSLPFGASTVLDFGSGAGFPGIPIAILRPEMVVTLAESQSKKVAFLREAVRTLGLSCEVYAGRVESLPEMRSFDVVAMRAVDKMAEAIPVARLRARQTLALLTTSSARDRYERLAPDFAWDEPIRLSRDGQAVLMLGRRI